MLKSKPCKWCGGTDHTALMCFKRPRKHIKKINDTTYQKEIATKWAWFDANPPDSNGQWVCYLQIHPLCPRILTRETIVQEHIKPKSSHPELKYVLSNRLPACDWCNTLKGSRSLEALAKIYPHLEPLLSKDGDQSLGETV